MKSRQCLLPGSRPLCKAISLLAFFLLADSVRAKQMYTVDYLCADWGPAMKLSSEPNESPQFSNTEDEIFFIKQLGSFTKTQSGTEGHGVSIYLCKMRSDGSEKTEIKELWHNVRYPIDSQAQSTWMDVNRITRQLALSITYAGSDITGLWTMALDGRDLIRINIPSAIGGHLQTIGNPSWMTDGKCLLFDVSLRGDNKCRIAKWDKYGTNLVYLSDGPVDCQPRVSPKGDRIVYVHDPRIKLGQDGTGESWIAKTLWLMDVNGSNKREIPNPLAKPSWPAKGISGIYPSWSPDGTKMFAVNAGIIEVATGKKFGYGAPKVQNWPKLNGQSANIVMPHWGKNGFLCSGWGGGIQLSDEAMEKMWILAASDRKEERW